MKSFKFPVFLLAMGLAILSGFAANVKPAETVRPYTVYYYSGNATLAQMRDIGNYGTSAVSCPAGDVKPCTFNWTGTFEAFEDHVENFPSIDQAKLEAASLRN